MKTHTSVYSTSKAGSQASDNQDAFSWSNTEDGYCDLSEQKFAISDGATEALYSGSWASLLTSAWTSRLLDFDSDYETVLVALAERWKESTPHSMLPWWAEEKIGNGTFATLAGLSITDSFDGSGKWSLVAVGDSCMFVVRKKQLIFTGPLSKSEEFGSSPYLIGSAQTYNKDLRQNLYSRSDTLLTGDEIILATDALACWFLNKVENGHCPAELFTFHEQENSASAFVDFVTSARANHEMRNDDVTLMSIQVL